MSGPNHINRRNHRVVQMCEQEEIILRKKREILERQQQQQTLVSLLTNAEEPPSSSGLPFKNTFSNDGSFLENFKKLTEAASFLEQDQLSPAPVIHCAKDPASVPDIPSTVQELVAMVVAAGDGGETVVEDRLRLRKYDLPQQLWFLFDLNSPEYRSYRSQVEASVTRQEAAAAVAAVAGPSKAADIAQFVTVRRGAVYREEDDDTEDSDTEFRREAKERNLKNMKNRLVCHYDSDSSSSDQQEQPKYEGSRFNQDNFPKQDEGQPENDSGPSAAALNSTKKKRKSRWDVDVDTAPETRAVAVEEPARKKSRIDRSNKDVIELAINSFGSVDLDEEQWTKVEQQFQIKQVYNEMLEKRTERKRMAENGRFKFEYDSDEDVEGGTWEHKLRKAEMEATRTGALHSGSNGRHHIGDFLPPDELKRFMEQHEKKRKGLGEDPVADYQDKKLTEENKGFQMLQKLGWKDGEGLGASSSGIVNPVNKSAPRESNRGLGVNSACSPEEEDNEYDAYRKRMMLAYRFRPNPMNNPRRAYY